MKKKRNRNNTLFLGLIFIIGLVFLVFANPVSESMNCSSDNVCKIKQRFCGGITLNKKIKLKENTNFDIVEQRQEIWGKQGSVRRVISTKYYYQPKINRKKIFIKPYIEDSFTGLNYSGSDYSRNICDNEIEDFYLYKNKKRNSYMITSGASDSEFQFFTILWIIVMGVLLLWSIFDKDAKF